MALRRWGSLGMICSGSLGYGACFRRAEERSDGLPLSLHHDVGGIEFDEHGVAAEFFRDLAHGSRAGEAVEHDAAFGTAGEDAGLDEIFREHGVMWSTT